MTWKNLQIRILGWLMHFGFGADAVFYVLTILVGLLAGLTAVGFHMAMDQVQLLLLGARNVIEITRPWYLLPLIPAGGALIAAILMKLFVPEARGSGIPYTKIAYVANNGYIPARVWIGKFFIGALNIGSGSSLGREGPTVQICGGLASSIGRLFSLRRERIQALVPVGAAAGLAAAFNTPIAAVTFTLEEMVGDLNARVLGSIVLASVSAAVVERALLGGDPIFIVPIYSLGSPWELFLYAVVGIASALAGVAFMRTLLFIRGQWKKLGGGWLSVLATALGGLAVGLMALAVPEVLGAGYSALNKALAAGYAPGFLAMLLVFKLVSTAVSYGTGSAGGIFFPVLCLGAVSGGLVAETANFLVPGLISHPGSFALVGMGASFAAVIRTPMTSVLIIFELTQDYNTILALMVANAVAFGLAKRLHPQSIYPSLSLQDGVALPDHETEHLLHEIHVADAMVTDVFSLPSRMTVREAIERTRDLPFSGYPVLDEKGKLAGMVSQYDFNQARAKQSLDVPLAAVATRNYILHAHPDQSLDSVMAKLGSRRISRLPVVSREDPTRLLGIITAEDVISAFGKTRHERMAGEESQPS
ncbi:MAG: chloride channel protein [Candidatus Tectomicrobia bacterium]|uniref:Chloride channel protein n=1 Tax=Tectimicrobiota bacterium TaxID=2528274 RepID=A0A932MPB5_UNCTE|nr:chloride channel protein [Candidatus Tectomicrobia bacterium]